METIGFKISEIRKQKGFSQEVLADLSKINLRTLQRIEKGESEPRGNTLRNLCQALEINVEDILDYGKTEDLVFIRYFHLSVLTFLVIPLGNIILPMILWLTKRDKILNLNEQGANLLNFQILWTMLFYTLVSVFAFFKIRYSLGYDILLYLAGFLYLINIVYPICVFVLIGKGQTEELLF